MQKLTDEQVQAAVAVALTSGGVLERCGQWYWLRFAAKPAAEVRAQLVGSGWKWSSKKAQWYLPVTYTFHGRGWQADMDYIRSKYGSEELHAA